MVYDSLRDRMVVFGGAERAGIPFDDTWEHGAMGQEESDWRIEAVDSAGDVGSFTSLALVLVCHFYSQVREGREGASPVVGESRRLDPSR